MKPNIGDKIIRLDVIRNGKPFECIWDSEDERGLNEGRITLDNVKIIEQKKVLICNNCKDIWIAPKEKCKCGCTTLTETHESNYKYAQNYNGA